MKEKVFIDSNHKRNSIVEELVDIIKQAQIKFAAYRKAKGEFQELQRKKGELEQKLVNFRV